MAFTTFGHEVHGYSTVPEPAQGPVKINIVVIFSQACPVSGHCSECEYYP